MLENSAVTDLKKFLGFESIDADLEARLLGYASWLCETHKKQLDSLLLESSNVMKELLSGHQATSLTASELAIIAKKLLIKDSKFPAMLCSECKGPESRIVNYTLVKAVYFVLGCTLGSQQKNRSAANSASREVRMLGLKKFNSLYEARVFKVFSSGASCLERFDELISLAQDSGDDGHVRRLSALRAPLADVLEDRADRLRERQTLSEHKRELVSRVEEIEEGTGSPRVVMEHRRIVEVEVYAGVSCEETLSDEPFDEALLTFRDSGEKATRQSVGMQKRAAKGRANRYCQASHMNPCDRETVDFNSASTALNVILSAKVEQSVSVIAGLSLFLGRPSNRLIGLFSREENEYGERILANRGEYILSYKVSLPENHLSGDLARRAKTNSHTIYLAIPSIFFSKIAVSIEAYGRNPGVFEENVKKGLAELDRAIYKTTKKRVTLKRLEKFLQISAKNRGYNPDDVANLVGISREICIEKYYGLTIVESIVAFHLDYTKALLESVSKPFGYYKGIESNTGKVGSRLSIEPCEAKRFIATLRKEAESPRGKSLKGRVIAHNWKTLYTFQLLALASAAREIRAPFQYRSDFDLVRGIVWVNDKQSRAGLAARQICLPAPAVSQIHFYLESLKELISFLTHLRPKLSAELRACLTSTPSKDSFSNASFLSVFEKSGSDYILEPLSPTFLLRSGLWGPDMPGNWQRHYVRQQLSLRDVPRQQINAVAGRGDFGEESEGIWSGMSMADCRETALAIEDIFEEIEALPLRRVGR